MELNRVRIEKNGRIATIYMDCPANLNALDDAMNEQLCYALNQAENDSEVRVVILTSGFGTFCAGGDIKAMYQGITTGELDFAHSIKIMAAPTLTIKKMTKPVIAAVKGSAAGAGFNIALACDYIIAEEKTKFIQAFVNIALVPDAGGFYLLTRSVGVNKATELAMTGRPVSAAEGKELGFVAQVASAEEFDTAVQSAAKKFAYGPHTAYAQMKHLLWESEYKDFEAYIEKEIEAQLKCMESPDFKEGISAFIEKRKAKYE